MRQIIHYIEMYDNPPHENGHFQIKFQMYYIITVVRDTYFIIFSRSSRRNEILQITPLLIINSGIRGLVIKLCFQNKGYRFYITRVEPRKSAVPKYSHRTAEEKN